MTLYAKLIVTARGKPSGTAITIIETAMIKYYTSALNVYAHIIQC